MGKKQPISNSIIALLFQGCVWPPYCNARINGIIKPIITAALTKSIYRIFSLSVAFVGISLFGVLKNNKTTMVVSPPIGRLT
jgi:hypothetical protein